MFPSCRFPELKFDHFLEINEMIGIIGINHKRKLFTEDSRTPDCGRESEDEDMGGQYIQIKTNKPYGRCPVFTSDPRNLQACNCNPELGVICDEESNCINRIMMEECHPSVCPCKELCCNQRFQKRAYPTLNCFRTMNGKGWGLKSLQEIKIGTFVIEYVGELITMEEYVKRLERRVDNWYFMSLDNARMIDGGRKGNLARFMNHSCDPNCVTQKWTVNGDTRVGLFAIKNIDPGEELTFNYQFETDEDGGHEKECRCGADNCSGVIGKKLQTKGKILGD